MKKQQTNTEVLVCPQTKQRLHLMTSADAAKEIPNGGSLATRPDDGTKPFGVTEEVMVREDRQCAYPVVDGIPVLLAPEMLFPAESPRSFDLRDPKYEEAYEEMEFYNKVGISNARALEETGVTDSQGYKNVFRLHESGITEFLEPRMEWLDATYDCAAQWDAYAHFGAVKGKRVMQLGGSGLHAIKFLLAGAAEAWLLTPMLGEATYARVAAEMIGMEDRFHCVIGVGEELPFDSDCFDAIFSGGCVHHMRTEVAFPEVRRVLSAGGRFAATDPWKAPLHTFGTRLLGKRETDVHCRPLTWDRVAPLAATFEHADVVHHGALTRYPLLALAKFGVNSSIGFAWKLFRADDALCSLVPPVRRMGSSVALLATKGLD